MLCIRAVLRRCAWQGKCLWTLRYDGCLSERDTSHFLFQGVYHFDNGSGTYAPHVDGLFLLKQVLRENFPQIRVEIHDFKKMESIREQLLSAPGNPVEVPKELNLRRVEKDMSISTII